MIVNLRHGECANLPLPPIILRHDWQYNNVKYIQTSTEQDWFRERFPLQYCWRGSEGTENTARAAVIEYMDACIVTGYIEDYTLLTCEEYIDSNWFFPPPKGPLLAYCQTITERLNPHDKQKCNFRVIRTAMRKRTYAKARNYLVDNVLKRPRKLLGYLDKWENETPFLPTKALQAIWGRNKDDFLVDGMAILEEAGEVDDMLEMATSRAFDLDVMEASQDCLSDWDLLARAGDEFGTALALRVLITQTQNNRIVENLHRLESTYQEERTNECIDIVAKWQIIHETDSKKYPMKWLTTRTEKLDIMMAPALPDRSSWTFQNGVPYNMDDLHSKVHLLKPEVPFEMFKIVEPRFMFHKTLNGSLDKDEDHSNWRFKRGVEIDQSNFWRYWCDPTTLDIMIHDPRKRTAMFSAYLAELYSPPKKASYFLKK